MSLCNCQIEMIEYHHDDRRHWDYAIKHCLLHERADHLYQRLEWVLYRLAEYSRMSGEEKAEVRVAIKRELAQANVHYRYVPEQKVTNA